MNERILAKSSGETLSEHTAWCIKAAKALLASLPLRHDEVQQLESDVVLSVALHDIGKAAKGFQSVLRGEQKSWSGRRHEILSAALGSSVPEVSAAVIFAILTHHKALPFDGITGSGAGCLPPEQLPWSNHSEPVWEEMAKEWLQNEEQFLVEWVPICKAAGRRDLLLLRPHPRPLVIDPRWMDRRIGKNGQRRTLPFAARYYASLVRGLTIAADHLGSAHRLPSISTNLRSVPVLAQEPRAFQSRAASTVGSALLRAPTGSGKTEAALLWSQNNMRPNGRLFYALPYTASINAMYKRLGPGIRRANPGIFGQENVGLLHSRATAALYSMLETDRDECSKTDRQENAKALGRLAREMWFPVRVCTPHQILRYVLRGKGWEVMLAEFPNACFVLDEIHAYDPRIVGLTLGTAKLLSKWGARFLIMSATLPDFLCALVRETLGDVDTIAPDPNEESDRETINQKRHLVEIRAGNLLDQFSSIVESAKSGHSTLVVCNHVRTAQQLYDRLLDQLHQGVMLLHSRFNSEDRGAIESRLLRSLPRVLVATQAIEVSLDIDFDRAFLEPAPIDALIQRMGRVNRAGRKKQPSRVIISTAQVNRQNLYCRCLTSSHDADCRVRRSLEELRGLPNPLSEQDLVDAANRIYSDGYQGSDQQAFLEGLNHPDIVQFEDRLLAGAHQSWVEAIIESTEGLVEVLPGSLRAEYQNRLKAGLWIEAISLLVSIRVRSFTRLRTMIDTFADPWVISAPYSKSRGLDI